MLPKTTDITAKIAQVDGERKAWCRKTVVLI
jgi:hypothetical protein